MEYRLRESVARTGAEHKERNQNTKLPNGKRRLDEVRKIIDPESDAMR